jgi:PilZ domain
MNTEDRRAPGVARINFDGLVEVGGALGPSFEAHALDVSEEGMHLRTAYLPELGQQVTCRFEAGAGQSVVGSGEVMWCRAADRGGEFGVRFTEMDAECVESLKRVCGFGGGAGSTQPGGKVRLYIEGLASPMRARVRDARATAITVGSDLGFLQVGKHLELEDTVSGSKRPASIDRVDVAVDPESHVPQLIVTLRYADVGAADPGRTEPPSEARPGRAAPPMFDDPPSTMAGMGGMGGMDEMPKGMLATQAARIGPAFERLGHRVKTTIALLAKRGRTEDDATPRRTTAPAPGGGLHASGRRVVRAETNDAADGGQPAARPPAASARRRAAIAAAVMATAVLGAVAIKRMHHESPPVTTASTNAPAAIDTGAPAAASPAMPATTGPSGDTSAAAAIAPPATAASQAAPATPAPATPPVVATPGDKAAPTTATATAEDGTSAAHRTHARPAPFANGPVHHGNVLRLRMDGPVEVLEGAQQPTGFTVKLPGRRSLEAAAPLAARDARIATIKVNNEPSGAELTVVFKDGVPNYRVSARGDFLVVALAPIGALETPVGKRDERAAKGSKHTSRMRDATPGTRDATPER